MKTLQNNYRRVKVTLYIDVPVIDNRGGSKYSYLTDDTIMSDIENAIERHTPYRCNTESEMVSEPLDEIVTSDCYGPVESPAGYILPNGQTYLLSDNENAFVHISLAKSVYDICDSLGLTEQLKDFSGFSIEERLNMMGVIKVHGYDVRYNAHYEYESYHHDGEGTILYSPDVTDEQIDALEVYHKNNNLEYDKLSFEHGWYSIGEIRQMDTFARRKVFSI